MPAKINSLKHAISLFTYLLLIWGFYRLIFQLPEEIEELVIKPVIWLIPVFFLLKKEQATLESLGLTFKNFFPAVYYSLALGIVFGIEGIITNFAKYGSLQFNANIGDKLLLVSLGISFATAISEEIAFRGFIFTRVWSALGSELYANLLTSLGWGLIHIPIIIFVLKLDPLSGALYLFLTILFGMGSAFVFARTKNIASSIFLHVLWQWPIILFR